jgi:hypothetical protein
MLDAVKKQTSNYSDEVLYYSSQRCMKSSLMWPINIILFEKPSTALCSK